MSFYCFKLSSVFPLYLEWKVNHVFCLQNPCALAPTPFPTIFLFSNHTGFLCYCCFCVDCFALVFKWLIPVCFLQMSPQFVTSPQLILNMGCITVFSTYVFVCCISSLQSSCLREQPCPYLSLSFVEWTKHWSNLFATLFRLVMWSSLNNKFLILPTPDFVII